DVVHAARHLGRPIRFSGIVQHGEQRGRKLGFPTANLSVPKDRLCPADGVYAGWVWRVDGLDCFGAPLESELEPEIWPAAISVGPAPTFARTQRRVEAYILDRDDLELYDAEIRVEFVERIRGQIRFNSVEELVAQMQQDVIATKKLLGIAPNPPLDDSRNPASQG
ncbi:MAG: riboflavin kinase, partial [Propionibacteriaceae bacterium]|nr:riboflavin kinase [Propionibacteriaceae bacterium]